MANIKQKANHYKQKLRDGLREWRHNLYFTNQVRTFAEIVGDDYVANNFSTAGMQKGEAVELGIVTIDFLSNCGGG